jgi:putative ABC transport system permease protein
MSALSRGVRNAFRNGIRTFSIVVILGLSVALALSMLLAHQAVQDKIVSIQGSIGNIITISPAGVRGFAGGGEPLTTDQVDKVKTLPHVVKVTSSLQDRLNSSDTNLQSALDLGSLGRRQLNQDNGQDAAGGGGAARFFGGAGGGNGGNGTFTPPIIVVGADDPVAAQALGGGAVTLTAGSAYPAGSNDNVAVVGQGLATKNNLSVGSTFQAYGTNISVAGIFTAGTRFSDGAVVMPLATLQRLSNQPNAVTSAVAQIDSINDLNVAETSIKNALGSAADVVSQQDTSQAAISPLKNIKSISVFSLTGAVVAGAVIIFLTMLMIVRERRREIAVLKAIGASNRKVMSQFVYEAVTFTILAAILGVAGGVVGGNPVTRLLVNNETSTTATAGAQGFGFGRAAGGGGQAATAAARAARQAARGAGRFNLSSVHAAAGWNTLGFGLLAAILIAVVGSAIPSWLISRIRPAEVLRGE